MNKGPAANPERLLWVRLAGVRRTTPQGGRCAVSGPSDRAHLIARFDFLQIFGPDICDITYIRSPGDTPQLPHKLRGGSGRYVARRRHRHDAELVDDHLERFNAENKQPPPGIAKIAGTSVS